MNMHLFSRFFQGQIVMEESSYRIHKLFVPERFLKHSLRKFMSGTRADLSQAHIKLQVFLAYGGFAFKADG